MGLILRKIYNRLHNMGAIIIEFVVKMLYKQPEIISSVDTANKVIENQSSLSRFGDGEMNIMLGRDIPFQNYDEKLAQKLTEVLKNEQSGLLVCIPNIFSSIDKFVPQAQKYYRNHLRENRRCWYRLTNRTTVYGNSFVTRFYIDWQDKTNVAEYIQVIRKMWHGRDIVFVEGEESRLGVGNTLFANAASIRRVICPKRNAFARYKEILDCVSGLEKSALIILALGPAATVMAADLHVRGFQALDLGHIDIEFEWYKMGASKKVPVKNKYTNETVNGIDVGRLADEEYLAQIIAEII